MHSGPYLTPMLRAVAALGDRAIAGVVLRSALIAAAALAGMVAVIVSGLHHLLSGHAMWAWFAGTAGGIGAALLSLWLFPPVAMVVASLYLERVVRAVERRDYPELPPARGAPWHMQLWDGLAVGFGMLALAVFGLLLGLVLPGLGLLLGWAVSAWAFGRGLFVAVAMLRMDRPAARRAYRRRRLVTWLQGALLTLLGTIPGLNLLVPVLGAAAMVHVLHGGALHGGGAGIVRARPSPTDRDLVGGRNQGSSGAAGEAGRANSESWG